MRKGVEYLKVAKEGCQFPRSSEALWRCTRQGNMLGPHQESIIDSPNVNLEKQNIKETSCTVSASSETS